MCAAVNSQNVSGQPVQFVTISQEEFKSGGHSLLQKMQDACRLGFFYLEIPTECRPLVSKTVEFAHTFYKDEKITKLELPDMHGFHKRPWQAESLFLETRDWKQYLPAEASQLAQAMHDISIEVLKTVLRTCEINEKEWSQGTGGLTDQKGWVHFCLNHYRAEIEKEGMEQHQDLGNVTVLYIDQEGLEMQKNNQWHDVPPKANHFVVNFGQTLEGFVGNPNRLVAALHRVKHVSDRMSFAIFTDNGSDTTLYTRAPNGELVSQGKYMDYITKQMTPTI